MVALIGLALLVPARRRERRRRRAGCAASLRAFRHPQVWLSLVITVLGFGGMFGAFTYIAYTLTEVSGFAASAVPWLLVLFGVGLFAGNLLGGRLGGPVAVAHPGHRPGGARRGARRLRADRARTRC